jgi:hypothetical protein
MVALAQGRLEKDKVIQAACYETLAANLLLALPFKVEIL